MSEGSTHQEVRKTVYDSALDHSELFRQVALIGLDSRAAAPGRLARANAPEFAYFDDFLLRARGTMSQNLLSPRDRVAPAVLEASVFLFASMRAWLEVLLPENGNVVEDPGRAATGDLICAVAVDAMLIEISDRFLADVLNFEIRMGEVVGSLEVSPVTARKYRQLFGHAGASGFTRGVRRHNEIALASFVDASFKKSEVRSFYERRSLSVAWEDSLPRANVVFYDRFAGRTSPIDDLPLFSPGA
jgi:hypothetical protein